MNNKGQVLVLFVILMPIILLLLLITIEIGNVYLDKQKTKNVIKNIIRDNISNNETIDTLIEENIKDIEEKTVFISDDEIRIYIKQNKKIFGRNINIEYKYKGIKKEEKIIISEG